jgi:Flp pilus assembly protein TadG
MKPAIQQRRGERGNAMIEFALSSILLVGLFIGAFQFGYTFYVYNKLQVAVRNGARYGSVRKLLTGSSASIGKYQTAVRQMVVYGDPAAVTGTTVAPGLTTAMVTVSITNAAGVAASDIVPPDRLQVSINGYNLDALFRTYSFTSKPVEAFPYVGRWTPGDTE